MMQRSHVVCAATLPNRVGRNVQRMVRGAVDRFCCRHVMTVDVAVEATAICTVDGLWNSASPRSWLKFLSSRIGELPWKPPGPYMLTTEPAKV